MSRKQLVPMTAPVRKNGQVIRRRRNTRSKGLDGQRTS